MSAQLLPWLGVSGVVAAVGVVVSVSVTSGSDTLPVAQAAPTTLSTTATTSATPTTSASTSSAPAAFQADSRGYVDTAARCDENQTLMAYGRTTKSMVVICVNADGGLEYRGVRLSDHAPLHLPITRSSDGTLVATNDGVTYAVSPTQMLVSAGDDVIYKDSWIEFKEASFESGTSSSAATSGSATTTVSTTTVTVTTSVTATSTQPAG